MGPIALLPQDRERKSEGNPKVKESAELTSRALGDDEERGAIHRAVVPLCCQL